MSGKRTKALRTEALNMGLDLTTLMIKGIGQSNLFRRIKKDYKCKIQAK